MNGKELGKDWQLERGGAKGLKLNSRKLNQNQTGRGETAKVQIQENF